MPIPQVETFETDITEEIKQKQGFVTDVLAAHSSTPPKTPDQTIIRAITFLIVFLLIALVAGIWYYFSIGKENIAEKKAIQKPIMTTKPVVSINTILPKTAFKIDRFVVQTTKESAGYIVTLNDYASVYGTILTDETTFGNELIKLFKIDTGSVPVFRDITINNQDIRVATLVVLGIATSTKDTTLAKTTTPLVPSGTSIPKSMATSTKITSSTSTKSTATKIATNTLNTSTTTDAAILPNALDPLTSFSYVSYGFIGTSTLLISTSQEKFLELRGVIIK